MADGEHQQRRGNAGTDTPEGEALDLITALFNANQRLAFAEDELANAKENKKACESEVARIHLLINDAVPRIRERLMVRGTLEQELPPIVKWRDELAKSAPGEQIIGGAEDGKKPADAAEIDPDDMTGTVIATNKGLRFGRFTAARIVDGPPAEWELDCGDCGRKISRIKVPADAEAIVKLRESAKVHIQLFHGDTDLPTA